MIDPVPVAGNSNKINEKDNVIEGLKMIHLAWFDEWTMKIINKIDVGHKIT